MKRIRKAAHHTYSGSLSLIAWTTFLCLALLLAARILFSAGPYFKDWLETELGRLVGQTVHIGELDTVWVGWVPKLDLGDVLVDDSDGGPGLRFRRLNLDLDLERLLTHARLEIGLIRLVGVDLSLERLVDGRLAFSGLSAGAGVSGAVGLPDWLFRIRHIGVTDSRLTWQDHQAGGPRLRFERVELQFQSNGRQHYVRGGMDLSGESSGRIEVAADLSGPGSDLQRWGGQGYLRAQGLDLAALPGVPAKLQVTVRHGRADVEFWGYWKETRLQSADARIGLRALALAGQEGAPGVHVQSLAAALRWRWQGSGWQLRLNVDDLRIDGADWPLARLAVDRGNAGEYRIAADRLRLRQALDVAADAGLLPAEVRDHITGIDPSAELEAVRLAFRPEDRSLRYDLGLRDLHTQAWRGLPGLSGVAARLQGDLQGGVVRIDSGPGSFDAPGLFAAPLRIQRVSAGIFWQRGAQGAWRVLAPDISLANTELSAVAYVRLDHPAEGEPWLEILADFDGPAAAGVPAYLPQKIFSDKLNHWLDSAFHAGRAEAGQFLYYGPMHAFPVPKNGAIGGSVFEVRAECRNVDLRFADDWPELKNVDGLLIFRDAAMDIEIHDVRVYGAGLRRGHVRIPRLGAKSVELKVAANALAPLPDVLSYLRASPLSQRFAVVTDRLEAQGSGELDLDLSIPLNAVHRSKVRGNLRLSEARLHLREPDLVLEKVAGTLHFTETGLRAEGIEARVQDEAVRLDLETGEQAEPLNIQVSGRTKFERLSALSGLKSLEHLRGELRWRADLDVDPYAGEMGLEFRSDLVGVAVNLPAPFRKSLLDARPLLIRTRFDGTGPAPVRVRYGSDVSAYLLPAADSGSLEQLVLHFGPGEALAAKRPGLFLTGSLAEVRIDPWMEVMRAAEYGPGWPPLQRVELKVDDLKAMDRDWADVGLRFERGSGQIVGLVTSAAVEGSIRIPETVQKLGYLEMNFSRFYWPSGDGAPGEAGSETIGDPRASPPLKIRIDDLRVGDVQLGSLRIQTEHAANGQRISLVELANPDFSITGSGNWRTRGASSETSLVFGLRAKTLFGLVQRFGYASAIKAARTRLDGEIYWRGAPQDFSPATLKGTIDLDVDEGQFLDLEPGVGRMFGLFSLENVVRRLRLDFSDLFGKGYSFDGIEGRVTIAGGDVFTDAFVMTAPSSRVEVAGRIGLSAEDYDERVKVIPKLTSTLPLAGVLTGGPALGGALLLAQALVGEKVDKILEINYRVTGPWDAPVVERELPAKEAADSTSPEGPADF